MRDPTRWLALCIFFTGSCASVPPAHVDAARDPASPQAREAPLFVAGELPKDDPTLKVGKPPFESGTSPTPPAPTEHPDHHHPKEKR